MTTCRLFSAWMGSVDRSETPSFGSNWFGLDSFPSSPWTRRSSWKESRITWWLYRSRTTLHLWLVMMAIMIGMMKERWWILTLGYYSTLLLSCMPNPHVYFLTWGWSKMLAKRYVLPRLQRSLPPTNHPLLMMSCCCSRQGRPHQIDFIKSPR